MRKRFNNKKIIFLIVPLTFLVMGGLYILTNEQDRWITYDPLGKPVEVSKEEAMKMFRHGKPFDETLEDKEKRQSRLRSRPKSEEHHPAYQIYKQNDYPEKYIENLNVFLNTPSEPDGGDAAVNNWISKGPTAINLRGTSTDYCGRVRDLETEGVPSLRAAGGTGGLFKTVLIFPVPISDVDVNTSNIGAFATNPLDTSIILLGTGEQPNYLGTGLWRTTNGGNNWLNIPSIPSPSIFYEIKFQPGSGTVVHAACNSGYYKSLNGGASWVQKLSGDQVTSLDVAPLAPNIIYVTKRNDGVYKSTDWGENFVRQNSYPLTGSNFKTASISIAYSNINIVYVNASNNSGVSSGIHRTTNGGTSWQDRSWRDGGGVMQDLHWGLGDRNNCIGVSPTNPDLILAGGGGLIRSTNGGLNYTIPPITHADMCVIKWRNNGTTVHIGNDGGIAYSTDGGAIWSTIGSIFPFTQFWSIEAGANSSGFVFLGGTQDNSVINTSNNGSTWYVNIGTGDGLFSTLDKNIPGNQMAGIHSGSGVPHYLYRSTNYGTNWTSNGIDANQRGGMVKNDFVSPVWYYVNNANKVYVTTNINGSWTQVGTNLPDTYINAISVGRYSAPYAPLYAILPNTTTRVMFYDGSNWVNRASGLPTAYINNIAQHPTNNNYAYAYTYYDLYPGNKIFRTTNKGLNWTNISGNFPNFTITGVTAHPTNHNILFASTTFYGVFKTTNGGSNWFRWMNGMPVSLWVEALAYVDSSAINGKFYVVAGSHGRGVYVRDGSGDDPLTGNNNNNTNLPREYTLNQNYPNPFNPSTTVGFNLPVSDIVTVQIFDITGKLVKEIMNNKLYSAGSHSFKFDGNGLSSGTYFYRITTPKFTDVKKMVLVK